MLTVLSQFMPRFKDNEYAIMVEYCIANVKYYSEKVDAKKCGYWSKLACKYLLKRIDNVQKLL